MEKYNKHDQIQVFNKIIKFIYKLIKQSFCLSRVCKIVKNQDKKLLILEVKSDVLRYNRI